MKRSVYKEIVRVIEQEEWDFEETHKTLKNKFPDVKSDTLRSILNQEYQKHVKKTHHYQTSEHKRRESFATYKSKASAVPYKRGIIIEIAKKNRFSPAQTAKIILEEHLKSVNGVEPQKSVVSNYLKNTGLIQDGKLAFEVSMAIMKDDTYGYPAECIKSSIGHEYERKAKRGLLNLGLTYQDENELRAKG